MGMYTELNCAFSLNKHAPLHIADILLYMTGQSLTAPDELPPHPLFGDTSWEGMLRGSSYYFAGDPHSTLRLDEIDGQYRVTIRLNFKNYDDEITKFIDWITPYIDALPGDFIGYSRYEDTEVPTLLYHPRMFITPQIPEEIFGNAAGDGSDWWESALPTGRK
jgi:hypothetical protein